MMKSFRLLMILMKHFIIENCEVFKKKMNSLEEKVIHYAKESKQLLKDIEVITEIENIQRLEIIKVKEKYRATNDNYAQIRFKVEDYVPKVQDVFHDIDERFVELENYMNNQQFEEAKTYTEDISKYIDALDQQLSDLPTYISVVSSIFTKTLKRTKVNYARYARKRFCC